MSGLLGVFLERFQQGVEIDRRNRLAVLAAPQKIQRCLRHALHIVQIAQKFLFERDVVQQLGAQPQPGDRSFKIVRDGGENPVAILDVADQPFLHGVEGAGGVTHFQRAGLLQRRAADVAAEFGGGGGQYRQRPSQRPHRQPGQQRHRNDQDQQDQQQPRRPGDDFLRQHLLKSRRLPVAQPHLHDEVAQAQGHGVRPPARRSVGAAGRRFGSIRIQPARPISRRRGRRQLVIDCQLKNTVRSQLAAQQRPEQRGVVALVRCELRLPGQIESEAGRRQIERARPARAFGFLKGVEQVDDGPDPLGDMAADGMVERLFPILKQDADARQLRDDQAAGQKQQQPAEQGLRQQRHQRSRLTCAASR